MRRFVWLAMAFLCTGCGGGAESLNRVDGIVTMDNQPLAGAILFFSPTGETKGLNGSAQADKDGKFIVMSPQGEKGLRPGTYKVIVSLKLMKDGSAPPPDIPPAESMAIESLPAKYSSMEHTILQITVEPDKKSYEIKLESGKKAG